MKVPVKNCRGIIVAALLILCSSWGFLVHRTVHQLAVYQLPVQMQPFFYKNMDSIVRHSVRPDERRNSDPTEATKHFIDFEAYGDSAAWKMPTNWNEAVQLYSKDSLLKYGYVPFWIMEMKARLTSAFIDRNRDSILLYTIDLGHYIGDAHVPLHTSINYDGQLTGQRGLHALWESVAPEKVMEHFKFSGQRSATYLKNPEQAIWNAVRHAHSLLPTVFVTEKELTKEFTEKTKYRTEKRNGREYKYYTKEFGQAYGERLQKSINDQLLRSANLMADCWYTAWVDGGKPDLRDLLPQKFTRTDKKAMKRETKMYRKDALLQHNLLLSKKNPVTDPASR